VKSDSHPTQTALVFDASAAIALVAAGPARERVREVIERQRGTGGRVIVPDLFWLEIANVLARTPDASSERAVDAIRTFDDLGVESVPLDRPLLLVVIDLAVRHRLTTYDAAYLAVAEVEDARLLTLDTALQTAAGARAMVIPGVDPHRLAEASAEYHIEPIDWARFGPYLASLRAEAEGAAGT
jgi:predicted nucleic acid-binding protein